VNSATRGYISVLAAAILWASSGTASKALFLGGVTPFELVQIRVTLAAAGLLVAIALFARALLVIRPRDLWYFLLLGGIALAMVQMTYLYAISKMQVAAAILIQYTSPFLVAVYSICFWGERLTAYKVIALVLALLGGYLVVGGYNLQLLAMNRVGAFAGLASAFLFAAYSLLGERGMHRYHPWTVSLYAFVFAALTWNIIYPPMHFLGAGYSAQQWGYMLYIALFGTLLPFGLFFVGVNHIRSTRASITSTAEPIAAGLIAYLFIGEVLEPLQIAGGTLVVAAIVLLQLQKERDDLTPAAIRQTRESVSSHVARGEEELPPPGTK
jgi:drug/metabolite transporter, DME family